MDAAAKLGIEKVSGIHTRGMEISLLILVRSFHASGLQGKPTQLLIYSFRTFLMSMCACEGMQSRQIETYEDACSSLLSVNLSRRPFDGISFLFFSLPWACVTCSCNMFTGCLFIQLSSSLRQVRINVANVSYTYVCDWLLTLYKC